MLKDFLKTLKVILLLFALLLGVVSHSESTPSSSLYAIYYQANGFNDISTPGFHTIQISLSKDKRLIGDTITQITVETEPIGSLQIIGASKIILDASKDEPCIFPLSIVIPDNDTCGLTVTLHFGVSNERHQHYFASEAGSTKFFFVDPRELSKKSPGEPGPPKPRPGSSEEVPPMPVPDSAADSIVVNPNDSTQKTRYYSDKQTPEEATLSQRETELARRDRIPIPEGNEHWHQSTIVGDTLFKRNWQDTVWRGTPVKTVYDPIPPQDSVQMHEQEEQMVHFSLSLQNDESYKAALQFFGTLEPMDSTGFYHGWAAMKVSRELSKLQIPHKEYPNYPSRYYLDSH